MSVRQSSYVEKHGQWTKGQITRDDDDIRFDSYMTDPAAASTLIGFGDAVMRKAGALATTVQKGVAAGGALAFGFFAGITMRNRAQDPERVSSTPGVDPVTVDRGQMISVLSRGCIAVEVGAAVAAGDPVHAHEDNGKFYGAAAASRIRIMDAQFLSAAAADGDLAELRLEGLRVANAENTEGP